MSQAFQLYQLQKIDTQIDQINFRLSEIEKCFANDTEIKAAENQKVIALENSHQMNIEMRKLEDEADIIRIKLEMNESSLYAGRIQNPKELKDLQAEVASNKKRLSGLEDVILAKMLDAEELEKRVMIAQNAIEEIVIRKQSEYKILFEEKDILEKNRDRLRREKPVITNSILSENVTLYEKLRNQKKGIAVTHIDEGACTMCGSTLTPAERQESRNSSKVVFCPSCGRILYSD
jgi:uncharacterized protein